MKKINIILLTVCLLIAVGCEDQLNQIPPTNITDANFYKNTTDMTQAVNAVYRALNGWDSRITDLSENRSDNIYVSAEGPREQVRINNFTLDLSNTALVGAPWTADYLGITRANIVLAKMNATNVPDVNTRNRLKGEVCFLRAFNYFDLVRLYGQVPIVTDVLTIDESTKLQRSPVPDVYNLILSDLDTAIARLPSTYAATAKLPTTYATVDRGRPSQWAAKALKALVYLTRSGPDYGINGPGLGSNEYSNALTLLDDIIANGKNYSGGSFSLITAGIGTATPYATVFSYTNEYNAEIVWDLQAIDDGTAVLTNGLGTILPTTWYETDYGTAQKLFAGGAESDAPKEISQSLLNSYPSANDKRDDFSILKSYVNISGNTINRGQYVKFLDISKKPQIRSNWSINFPIIRYADILLWKAEALIQGSGSSSAADQLINQVRHRAGLTVAEDVVNATIDNLLDESRREFAGEGRRWFDLIRSGKVITIMNAWINTEDANRLKVITYPMDPGFIIYPIPSSELQFNSSWQQNVPYQ